MVVLVLIFLTDKIGQNEFLSLNLSYSYQVELSEGKLGIGISFGVIQDEIDGLILLHKIQIHLFHLLMIKLLVLDLGMGLFYNSEKLYVGLSSKHINEPTISTSIDIIDIKRHYYINIWLYSCIK